MKESKELLCSFPDDESPELTWYIYVDKTFRLSDWEEDDFSTWKIEVIDGVQYFYFMHSGTQNWRFTQDVNGNPIITNNDQLFLDEINLAYAMREMIGDE